MIEIAAIALVFLIFSLFSRQLASTLISAQILLAAGLLLASDPVGLVRIEEL